MDPEAERNKYRYSREELLLLYARTALPDDFPVDIQHVVLNESLPPVLDQPMDKRQVQIIIDSSRIRRQRHVDHETTSETIRINSQETAPRAERWKAQPKQSTFPPVERPRVQEEDVLWEYRDPHGDLQGPFSNTLMKHWYSKEYFPGELLVRMVGEIDFLPLVERFKNSEPFVNPVPVRMEERPEEREEPGRRETMEVEGSPARQFGPRGPVRPPPMPQMPPGAVPLPFFQFPPQMGPPNFNMMPNMNPNMNPSPQQVQQYLQMQQQYQHMFNMQMMAGRGYPMPGMPPMMQPDPRMMQPPLSPQQMGFRRPDARPVVEQPMPTMLSTVTDEQPEPELKELKVEPVEPVVETVPDSPTHSIEEEDVILPRVEIDEEEDLFRQSPQKLSKSAKKRLRKKLAAEKKVVTTTVSPIPVPLSEQEEQEGWRMAGGRRKEKKPVVSHVDTGPVPNVRDNGNGEKVDTPLLVPATLPLSAGLSLFGTPHASPAFLNWCKGRLSFCELNMKFGEFQQFIEYLLSAGDLVELIQSMGGYIPPQHSEETERFAVEFLTRLKTGISSDPSPMPITEFVKEPEELKSTASPVWIKHEPKKNRRKDKSATHRQIFQP